MCEDKGIHRKQEEIYEHFSYFPLFWGGKTVVNPIQQANPFHRLCTTDKQTLKEAHDI